MIGFWGTAPEPPKTDPGVYYCGCEMHSGGPECCEHHGDPVEKYPTRVKEPGA